MGGKRLEMLKQCFGCIVPSEAGAAAAVDGKNDRWCWLRGTLYALMLFSFVYFTYFAFFSSDGHDVRQCPFCAAPPQPPAAAAAARSPTTLAHVVFAIGASNATWEKRRLYSGLWWRPGAMRGHVWLDDLPSGPWPATCPPYRVLRANESRFGAEHAPAARMAQVVAEAYRSARAGLEGEGEVRWLVMGDDDTVFFPENLVAVLDKYDHREMYYVGATSESVEQNVEHSYSMAFGGGGFALSSPAAAALAEIMERCLDRYNEFYGSDHRVQACLAELGVPLTREPGFHQLDLQGHVYGFLAAHPVAPLVSLHHLDNLKPISPNWLKRASAIQSLIRVSRYDPGRALQQTICYLHKDRPELDLSVSVSWGYMIHLYPAFVAPHELETPLRTFRSWKGSATGPFMFNTRPVAASGGEEEALCEKQPLLFYLDTVEQRSGQNGVNWTVTEYIPEIWDGKLCNATGFGAATKIEKMKVLARKMDPAVWKRAPRRQCCEVHNIEEENTLVVKIHECRPNYSTILQ